MWTNITNSQVDQLGERLRKGPLVEADLRLLNEYRHSFGDTYNYVIQTIREKLALEPTGRPAKSTPSLVAKLRRETIRLSQVQDIAGCRLVLAGVAEQDLAVDAILAAFPDAGVVDRRTKPSHGYRAVHIIVVISGKPVEVQVRSSLQHLWGELSEKLSDLHDPMIKYGLGDPKINDALMVVSRAVEQSEGFERRLSAVEQQRRSLSLFAEQAIQLDQDLVEVRKHVEDIKQQIATDLSEMNNGLKG